MDTYAPSGYQRTQLPCILASRLEQTLGEIGRRYYPSELDGWLQLTKENVSGLGIEGLRSLQGLINQRRKDLHEGAHRVSKDVPTPGAASPTIHPSLVGEGAREYLTKDPLLCEMLFGSDFNLFSTRDGCTDSHLNLYTAMAISELVISEDDPSRAVLIADDVFALLNGSVFYENQTTLTAFSAFVRGLVCYYLSTRYSEIHAASGNDDHAELAEAYTNEGRAHQETAVKYLRETHPSLNNQLSEILSAKHSMLLQKEFSFGPHRKNGSPAKSAEQEPHR